MWPIDSERVKRQPFLAPLQRVDMLSASLRGKIYIPSKCTGMNAQKELLHTSESQSKGHDLLHSILSGSLSLIQLGSMTSGILNHFAASDEHRRVVYRTGHIKYTVLLILPEWGKFGVPPNSGRTAQRETLGESYRTGTELVQVLPGTRRVPMKPECIDSR